MKKYGKNTKIDYWFKAFKWFFLNLAFGVFPLILMGLVTQLTNGKDGQSQVDHLIYEGGIVLFVSIAIMGAVVVDYGLSGYASTGLNIFRIYIFPIIILGFVSLVFLLICEGKVSKSAFGLTAPMTIIVVVISFLYCTFTKANLYLKEDFHERF